MKHQNSRRWMQKVVLAAICTATGMTVQAANADTMHEIPSEITSLRNARDEIRYRHQAEADVAQADHDLQVSRQQATARK